MTFDMEALLQPVSADAPAGPNLEYSAAFAELERARDGRPERQMGDAILAAADPDWPLVAERAVALLGASKDLRVAAALARALLQTRGVAGFGEGLALVRHLLSRYWVELHPPLDEGADAATARINAIAALTHRDTLQAIRSTPIAHSQSGTAIAIHDLDAARDAPRGASIGAILQGAVDVGQAIARVAACEREARELEAEWGSLVNGGPADFSGLRHLLERALGILRAHTPIATASDPDPQPPAVLRSHARDSGVPSVLRTRDDVVRSLESIRAYYLLNEPSSPVPLLLQRCQRLVTMSFLDIVQDVFPDSLGIARALSGRADG